MYGKLAGGKDCILTTVLLFNRLLCTFNDLVELGAYIVQGISNTHTDEHVKKKNNDKSRCKRT